ncbi:MAG: hypothetical protein LH624_02680 [Cryobacterium sp.]|nr:hypothetical protein [Cryobacterium sp.]
MTNTTPNSCVDVKCDCNTMWSLAQQFSYLRLSDETTPFNAALIKDYAVRARRIAATYARFYLEQEQGGDPAKKGRFYWMALGAFASKTVACTLEDRRVRLQSVAFKATKEGLGKGNFWLFCDISGWHWYYSMYAGSFDMCLDGRNSDNYVTAVKAQVKKLPWSAEALPKIKKLAVSKEIRVGFAKVREFETETNVRRRPQIQLEHLLAIADHEQGVILQPLIYDDPDFVYWLRVQRSVLVNWASPNLELVFSSACSTSAAVLSSVAPEDTKLEYLKNRMKWIGTAAVDFHKLMFERQAFMEGELTTMAGWVGLADR